MQETLWLNNLPVATVQNGTLFNIHPDHLGTPRIITDANQQVIWRWESEPFGNTQPNEDPDGDGTGFTYNLRFPGQYYDPETGRHYNYFRDYDPATGRYITSDPIGVKGGLNVYAYVKDNPLILIDFYGLEYSYYGGPGQYALGHDQSNPTVINASIGAGGSGIFLPAYGSADSGVAFDSTGTLCFYSVVCWGAGWNTPLGGELGIVGGIGGGRLCTGSKEVYGVYWSGGEGFVGQGQALSDGAYSRVMFGVGGSPEGAMSGMGGMRCAVTHQCIFESPQCSCENE